MDGLYLRRIFMRRSAIAFAAMALFGAGCESFSQPSTALQGKSRHTGEISLFRVANTNPYKIGTAGSQATTEPRFVPLAEALDVRGLDQPANLIGETTPIKIILNNGFVRYFKEAGGARRKGEMAIVISFDSGEAKSADTPTDTTHDSLLIFASEGQTLASSISVKDWPIIGPITVPADELMLRVVMIEIDRVENKTLSNFVDGLATTAGIIQPAAGFVIGIAKSVADTMIGLNVDDVVLDEKVALHRVAAGQTAPGAPLLAGTYAIMLQEDKLGNDEVAKVARRATFDPERDRLRFHLGNGRLYQTFNYYPISANLLGTYGDLLSEDKAKRDAAKAVACPGLRSGNSLTFRGNRNEGATYVESRGLPKKPSQDGLKNIKAHFKLLGKLQYRDCLMTGIVNATGAVAERRDNLGYVASAGRIDDRDIFGDLDGAFDKAYYNTVRGGAGDEPSVNKTIKKAREEGHPHFDFDVVQFPAAYTLLSRYAQHTHLVMSVRVANDASARKVHDNLPDYATFLQQQITNSVSAQAAQSFATAAAAAATDYQKAKMARIKADESMRAGGSAVQQVCALSNSLNTPAAGATLSLSKAAANEQLFRKIKGRIERTFNDVNGVEAYLTGESCTITSGVCTQCP
jgi:hypothetical protein